MAEIAPFRGLRYNSEKVPDLARVVIPPYDVISPSEQKEFYRSSPYNMVRLELGMATSEDSPENNPHTRAAAFLRDWQRDEVLVRDTDPSVYYYELDYSLDPQLRKTRYGFICALKLEDFSSGSVRPHEKTFQAVKDERLQLMLSCHANLSPVFALYADPEQSVDNSLRAGRDGDPVVAFTDARGMEHRLWRVRDLAVLERVRDLMRGKALFIADGHHRYETALNYRNLQRRRHGEASPRATFEYIMVYLSNLNQEGLTILPTHRLLRRLGSWSLSDFLDQAGAYFEISSFASNEAGEKAWRNDLEADGHNKETTIGFYPSGGESFYLMRARREAVSAYLTSCGIPQELQCLDVVVLDRLILKRILGLSETFLADADNIHFSHDFSSAVRQIRKGGYDAGFLINSTRIEQVQEVANSSLIMPHKSTYFYPKVGSGMVVHPLSPHEEAIW